VLNTRAQLRITQEMALQHPQHLALRSLRLEHLNLGVIWPGFLVVAVVGAVMIACNVRVINTYD
jgi:hypothetical protein